MSAAVIPLPTAAAAPVVNPRRGRGVPVGTTSLLGYARQRQDASRAAIAYAPLSQTEQIDFLIRLATRALEDAKELAAGQG